MSENQNSIMICLYQEHLNQARHQENQRSTMSNLILIICSALLAAVTLDKDLSLTDLPLTLFLFSLGVYGAVFSAKYYERFKLHYERSRIVRKQLEKIINSIDNKETQKAADIKTRKQFPIMFSLRLYWLWIILMLIISVVGLGLTVAILVAN
jgi:Ca2+/Na+ antiporter